MGMKTRLFVLSQDGEHTWMGIRGRFVELADGATQEDASREAAKLGNFDPCGMHENDDGVVYTYRTPRTW